MAAWNEAWLERTPRSKQADLWRGVEAQHVVSTLRLVDSLAEQRLLEELLEDSKPAAPHEARRMHYLLFTPFRYRSPVPSRFRTAHDAGIWYGAEDLETACAEVAFWRWRFLMDSEAFEGRSLLTQHSIFRARVTGSCIDLSRAPWNTVSALWLDPNDYSACQQLALQAQAREVSWIRHRSVRRAGGYCGAVLRPEALRLRQPFEPQTWVCKTTRHGVFLSRELHGDKFEFSAAAWH